jgi:hypothetical protein
VAVRRKLPQILLQGIFNQDCRCLKYSVWRSFKLSGAVEEADIQCWKALKLLWRFSFQEKYTSTFPLRINNKLLGIERQDEPLRAVISFDSVKVLTVWESAGGA